MNSFHPARRDFLQLLGGAASAAWLTANWPALVSAAEHAHRAAKSEHPALEVFTADQAREVEALCACIIPSDATAGPRDAVLVYFTAPPLKPSSLPPLPPYPNGPHPTQQ